MKGTQNSAPQSFPWVSVKPSLSSLAASASSPAGLSPPCCRVRSIPVSRPPFPWPGNLSPSLFKFQPNNLSLTYPPGSSRAHFPNLLIRYYLDFLAFLCLPHSLLRLFSLTVGWDPIPNCLPSVILSYLFYEVFPNCSSVVSDFISYFPNKTGKICFFPQLSPTRNHLKNKNSAVRFLTKSYIKKVK